MGPTVVDLLLHCIATVYPSHYRCQGPFTWEQMRHWYEAGYFNADRLLVKNVEEIGPSFIPLRTAYPDDDAAFIPRNQAAILTVQGVWCACVSIVWAMLRDTSRAWARLPRSGDGKCPCVRADLGPSPSRRRPPHAPRAVGK